MHRGLTLLAAALALLCGCSHDGDACSGFTVTGTAEQSTFTIPQLMAHAAAMGLTQEEAEALIYLEGISPATSIAPGETVCIDGTPDR